MQVRRYAVWGGILKCLLVLPFSFQVMAGTDGDRDCPRAKARGADGMQIEFGQYQFPDGSSDLALGVQSANGTDIKRVTYGGDKTEGCRYQSVAVIPGGSEKDQWGWHLAWAGAEGVRYARMDGEAWVSSPPKRLSMASASEIQLQVNGPELLLLWHEQRGNGKKAYQAISHDEGRSWEPPQQLHPDD